MATTTPPNIDKTPNVPKVSIGMPVYNGERFIREALDSLLTQSFTDFELIISDNASTDGTETICREYAARDSRVRYIRQDENHGSPENFRFVLQQAVSKYFMWAAYDDLRPVNSLEKLYLNLEENKSYAFSFGAALEIDEQGEVISPEICFDFDASSAFARVKKYWIDQRALKDIPIYGLHRRRVIARAPLAPWRWLNAGNPRNTAHPVVTFCLASGRFGYLRDEIVFYRRVLQSGSIWSHAPNVARESMVRYFTLKCNLTVRSILAVKKGSQSYMVAAAAAPVITVSVTYRILRNAVYWVRELLWSSAGR